jgi:N-acetylglucosaminyldiphosphoundecaprenol N-acetyl-beta-D-mannosaminyltransferase
VKELVDILGVTIHNVTATQAIESVDAFVSSQKPHKIIVANAAKLVKAQKDTELLSALRTSNLVTADGISIVLGARMFGVKLVERVTGSEHLLPLSCELAAQKEYSVFFLGAGPGVAEKAAGILKRQYPGLKVAGTYSPGYNVLHDEGETKRAVGAVREVSPDILFVALGTPKQEKWISRNLDALGVPVTIGVGATLDFIAGVSKRPPPWVHGVGFAWLYRLLHEPTRLWRRNFEGLVFIALVARERLFGRKREEAPTNS